MEKAPTRAFSWLKAATTAFTFKTLLSKTLCLTGVYPTLKERAEALQGIIYFTKLFES